MQQVTSKSTGRQVKEQVGHYLRTGHSDELCRAWPGKGTMERIARGHEDLMASLVAEVKRRSAGRSVPTIPDNLDVARLARRKTESMVCGLFTRAEQDIVLAHVEQSVVFLTPENVEVALRGCGFRSTSWDIANLYLGAVGAGLLGDTAPNIVGLNDNTTCYVSPVYFEESDPFADFVVHEVAHIFHNCRRQTIGLRETRTRKYLLEVDFRHRETFAYSCEAYARIIERSPRLAGRIELAREYARSARIADSRADSAEVADIVMGASGRRNGWNAILVRCAPPKELRARRG